MEGILNLQLLLFLLQSTLQMFDSIAKFEGQHSNQVLYSFHFNFFFFFIYGYSVRGIQKPHKRKTRAATSLKIFVEIF